MTSKPSTETIYSFDTCWFLNLELNYPIDLFEPVWTNLASLLKSKNGYLIETVLEEIGYKDEKIYEWLKPLKSYAVAYLEDADLLKAQEIMQRFPEWVDIDATRTVADPFIVAEAVRSGAKVITHETKIQMQANTKKAKVPNACDVFGVPCLHTKPGSSVYSEFFREVGWKF